MSSSSGVLAMRSVTDGGNASPKRNTTYTQSLVCEN